jgi:hypothetical protein
MSTKSHSSSPSPWEVESPFLNQELLVGDGDGAWEPRAAALVAESPFADALRSTSRNGTRLHRKAPRRVSRTIRG